MKEQKFEVGKRVKDQVKYVIVDRLKVAERERSGIGIDIDSL